MKRKLTQDLIDRGECKDPHKCPLALLLRENMRGVHRIEVDFDTEYHGQSATEVPHVMADGELVRFRSPDKIVDFIKKFDAKKPVKPFWVEWDDV